MPQRDHSHDLFINALVKSGWEITHDPYVLSFDEYALFVDIGATATYPLPQNGDSAMDIVTHHRNILKETLLHYAQFRPSHGDIRVDIIFDEERDHYALMHVGWNQGKRVKNNIFYAIIHNGKIHLEHDGIGYGISDDLIARGILEEDIVLAWLEEAPTIAHAIAEHVLSSR